MKAYTRPKEGSRRANYGSFANKAAKEGVLFLTLAQRHPSPPPLSHLLLKRMASFCASALHRLVLPVPGGPCRSTTLCFANESSRGARHVKLRGGERCVGQLVERQAWTPGPVAAGLAGLQGRVHETALPHSGSHLFQLTRFGSTLKSVNMSAELA